MIRKLIQTSVVALGILGTNALAGDGASFAAGGSFLLAKPAFGQTGMGGGIHFDLHHPIKGINGLEWGYRSFLANVTMNEYVNTDVSSGLQNTTEDLDREFFYAGLAIGPRFKTEGPLYFLGTAGFLITANYASDKTYPAADNVKDREVASGIGDLSLGGEGSVGLGFRLANKMTVELSAVAMGASSENAPGIMMTIGPKLTLGMSL